MQSNLLIMITYTLFRDDFSPKFVALFTLLLFLKSFHWLAEDRVDFMERSPSITALFHVRVIFLALILAFVDVQFIMHAYGSTVSKGPSVQLVFGFEYAVLVSDIHCEEFAHQVILRAARFFQSCKRAINAMSDNKRKMFITFKNAICYAMQPTTAIGILRGNVYVQ